jgi:phosphoribosyl-dephospho-CoA transferase
VTSQPPAGRHAVVRVRPEAAGDGSVRLEGTAPPLPAFVRDWLGAGRPLVVRRPCRDAAGRLCCGLPTPPGDGKLRLALSLTSAAVATVEPPPLLTDCLDVAPAAWRTALAALGRTAGALGLAPLRVCGSLAWQWLTSLPYLTPDSDVDILADVTRQGQLTALASALAVWEAQAGIRCDAEIRLPHGACFSWREYAAAPRKLLVKTDSDVFLALRQTLVDGLPQ